MKSLFIIHYGEIGLKKGNRGFFEKILTRNIHRALKDFSGIEIRKDFGRILLSAPEDYPSEVISERLKDVMGVAYFSQAHPGSSDITELQEQIFAQLASRSFNSFCINTRRSDPQFPLRSMEVNKIIGARIHTGLDKKVDLEHPDLTCFIEIYNQKVFYYFEKIESQHGLPIGSSGKVVCLLSAGIDSPVAAYRMMTRGCKVALVHFHSFPFTSKTSYYNAIALAQKLTRYQYNSHVYLIPLAKIQEAIILQVPERLRIIFYRRAMLRLADLIARQEKAVALVTGDSVGQVASQTLRNIAVISEAVALPILRPLIAMDKDSIIQQARRLDTFDISTEPYDDCCSYLAPANPETKANIFEVKEIEKRVEDLPALLAEAISATEKLELNHPQIQE